MSEIDLKNQMDPVGFEQVELPDGGFKRRRIGNKQWQRYCQVRRTGTTRSLVESHVLNPPPAIVARAAKASVQGLRGRLGMQARARAERLP